MTTEETELTALTATATELTATLAGLESKLTGLNVKHDEEIRQRDAEIADHRDTLATLQSDLQAMAAAATEAGRRVEATETELAPTRAKIARLEGYLADPGKLFGSGYGTETAVENEEG